MELTRKRIVSFIGLGLGGLGFILLIAGFASAGSKWDDEDCCKGKTCGAACELLCGFGSSGDSWFEDSPGCCYGTSDNGPPPAIFIFGAVALGCVIITLLVLECGDKICCECCQKCTAVILGIINVIGLIFTILLIVALLATTGGSSGATSCKDTTIYSLLGVNGVMVASVVFLAFGVVCSLVTTFIECCCDDSAEKGGAETN